jgi:hypothetical protein
MQLREAYHDPSQARHASRLSDIAYDCIRVRSLLCRRIVVNGYDRLPSPSTGMCAWIEAAKSKKPAQEHKEPPAPPHFQGSKPFVF